MNREIKFRAWHKENKEMFEVGEMDFNFQSIYYSMGNISFDEFEIMQFTGLKDKNGKEIYEGDIVKYTFDLPGSKFATENGLKVRIDKVFWSEWRSSFAIGNGMANNNLFNYVRNGNRVEIIGNIHDNPELIRRKNNGISK